jgi:hypothetical protein
MSKIIQGAPNDIEIGNSGIKFEILIGILSL